MQDAFLVARTGRARHGDAATHRSRRRLLRMGRHRARSGRNVRELRYRHRACQPRPVVRVAALYDVHGMPWALEAVLAEVDTDVVLFGGDWFGGPYNEETYERILRVENATLIRGNAENEDPRTSALPLSVEIDGIVYCHATPSDNLRATTAITPEADVIAMFGERGTFVIGHTHHQFDRRIGDLRVVNAGSVGMAYESDVAAFWLLVENGEPHFRRTAFDITYAVTRVRASDWPMREAFVAENLLVAADREEAIAVLEGRR
jgi:predicted phosphodiesterase